MTDRHSNLNFVGGAKITGLPQSTAAGEPVTHEQLQATIEGLAWKDDVHLASTGNVNLATPGANLDGVAMVNGRRYLLKDQTAPAENGVYIFNGAAAAMTRAADMSVSAEFNSAVVGVNAGATNGGTTWRQTAVDPVVGTTAIVFTSFQGSAPAASEATAGIAEIATQAETDAGTDDQRIVTPAKLANSATRAKRFAANIGDAAATSFALNHNLNTRDVMVQVFRNSGSYDTVEVDVTRTSVNQVTIGPFATAPAANAFRVVVLA